MKISILSPVRNEEQYVDEMIRSVQQQQHSDWELVFVDDASTDATVALIKRAAEVDSRIRLASEGKKLGKAAAFNLAFRASSGDVIVLLAGDDRLPEGSLSTRSHDMVPAYAGERLLACYRLRTFSEDPRYDGMVLPRGRFAVSHSGGVLTMSRPLAEKLFPIPEELPSEDLWLGYAAPHVAERVVSNVKVIMEYRIHGANSNPRGRCFAEMSTAIARRHEAWRLLKDSSLPLPAPARRHLAALWEAERYRRRGQLWSVARTSGLSAAERASFLGMANPGLHWVRSRFYRLFSGRQGR